MPRGRKKSQSSGAPALRVSREGSEESSIADEAPKLKDCRLEESPFRSRHKSKITDYYSPDRERSPPKLTPEVPLPLNANNESYENDEEESKHETDRASDKSEGDSGKENEEEPKWSSTGARPKKTENGKKNEKSIQEQRVTRSRTGGLKMPLLSLNSHVNPVGGSTSSTNGTIEIPSSPPSTPISSPTKTSNVGPTSPPTPHKIKLLESQKSATSSAIQKIKMSFSPKMKSSGISEQSSSSSANSNSMSTMTGNKGPKKKSSQQPKSGVSKPKPTNSNDKIMKSNHKMTEFFPIRRSRRKPKAEIEKEQLADIEDHLIANNDDDLDISVQVFPEKGRGIVANRKFTRGEFVVEYAGDLIDVGVAKEREAKYSMDLSTGCYMYYFKHKAKQYCIDATSESGRLGRLVNHSRLQPNLQTKVVTFKDRPRLILVARKDIEPGEELLYDYGDRSKESLKAHPWLAL